MLARYGRVAAVVGPAMCLTVAAAGSACSLRNLSYLDSAYDGGRTTDAAIDAHGDARPTDGGRETGSRDTGGKDVGRDVERKDAGPFCRGRDATFCDDFDESPLGSGWTSEVHDTVAIFELSDASISPPYSARLGMMQLDTPDTSANSSLTWASAGNVSHLTFSADIRIDAAGGAQAGYPVFVVGIGDASVTLNLCPGTFCGKLPGQNAGFISEFMAQDAANCPDGAGQYYQSLQCYEQRAVTQVPPLGTWSTIVIDVVTNPATVTMTINGASALADTNLYQPGWASGRAKLSIGQGYLKGPLGEESALFDNVVINAE